MSFIENRSDMTSWVTHFIHDRNPKYEPDYLLGQIFPVHVDKELNDRFASWGISDYKYPLEPDASALSVLLKIIVDGHIRSGWAYRNNKPSVYGPRAACCFTEMPLSGLVNYAKTRSSESVSNYVIALQKSEFFEAGGRPVIYGLSHFPKEDKEWTDTLFKQIGSSELYRYVSTDLSGNRKVDWTHEREWRWVDHEDKYDCPGLPIWLVSEQQSPLFTQSLIMINKEDETAVVLDQLKKIYDTITHNYSDANYDRALLENTKVVSFEKLESLNLEKPIEQIRLEDIPFHCMDSFSSPVASESMKTKVKNTLEQAHRLAKETVENIIDAKDVCGFAYLCCDNPQTEFVSALIELNEITIYGGEIYQISNFDKHAKVQALCVHETAVEAAQKVFERDFPDIRFFVKSVWD